MGISILSGMLDIKNSKTEERIVIACELANMGKLLEKNLLLSHELISGISNFVRYQGYITYEQLQSIGEFAFDENNIIASVAIAPNNTVTMCYPQKGFESILNYHYPNNNKQWSAIERAIESKKSCITGPVSLDEGGIGFINYTPIYLLDKKSGVETYWGLISVVENAEKLYHLAGITNNKLLSIAISNEDSLFFGDSRVINNNPVDTKLNMKYSTWTLYAVPIDGWCDYSFHNSAFFWCGIIITFLVLVLILALDRNNRSIKQSNSSLAYKISELEKLEIELKKAKENAESESYQKTMFLADMAHEIRSPMNSIQGFTELIMNRGINASTMGFIEIINSSSKRLLTIINDAIDISMIESGNMKLFAEQVSLNKVLNNVVKLNQINANKNSNEIITSYGLENGADYVMVDSNRLTQVINNLVTNALKFTKNGQVTVGYTIDDDKLKFFVIDTGVGIPHEQGNSIFSRYTQVDGKVSTTNGGSGIGLSICKAIVEIMNGEIWYESEVNVGSKFYFTIPYKTPDIPKTTLIENKIMKIDLTGKSILITDDEASNRALFTAMFKPTNANLIMAKSGQQTIDIINSGQHVDLILMDIKMLGMDGYETTRQIRKIGINVPIIAQTAYIMGENRQMALDAGCNYYITKPIDIQELFSLIDSILNKE